MTKKILIINGDCSDFKVKVTAQVRCRETGEWIDEGYSDSVTRLDFPAALAQINLWDGKRLIIEEDGVSDYSWRQKDNLKGETK